MAESVEARLERALAEADSLAALDRQLAAEIARRQAALAARIASTPSVARASRGATRQVGSVSLTSGGITVATELAQPLQELLAAAAADGFNLGGSGYRSSDGGPVPSRSRSRPGGCTSAVRLTESPVTAAPPPTAPVASSVTTAWVENTSSERPASPAESGSAGSGGRTLGLALLVLGAAVLLLGGSGAALRWRRNASPPALPE